MSGRSRRLIALLGALAIVAVMIPSTLLAAPSAHSSRTSAADVRGMSDVSLPDLLRMQRAQSPQPRSWIHLTSLKQLALRSLDRGSMRAEATGGTASLQIPWNTWPTGSNHEQGQTADAAWADGTNNIFKGFHTTAYTAAGMTSGYYQQAEVPIAVGGLYIVGATLISQYATSAEATSRVTDAVTTLHAGNITTNNCPAALALPSGCQLAALRIQDGNGNTLDALYAIWSDGAIVAEGLTIGVEQLVTRDQILLDQFAFITVQLVAAENATATSAAGSTTTTPVTTGTVVPTATATATTTTTGTQRFLIDGVRVEKAGAAPSLYKASRKSVKLGKQIQLVVFVTFGPSTSSIGLNVTWRLKQSGKIVYHHAHTFTLAANRLPQITYVAHVMAVPATGSYTFAGLVTIKTKSKHAKVKFKVVK